MGNRLLRIFATLALTVLLVSSGKVYALSVIDYRIDSTEIHETIQSSLAGMYLHHPCLLILRYYRPDSLRPILGKAEVKPIWEGWTSTDQIRTDGYHVWAEDTLHQLNLQLAEYGKFKLTGLRLCRDSITIVPVLLWPGRDSGTFDYSRHDDAGMKLFPMPKMKSGVVHGRVVDAETSEPIGGARVSLPDEQVSAITDDSGKFTLASSQFGNDFRVMVAHDDYDTVDVGLRKGLPQTELSLQVFLTERPSWWQKLFAKKVERGLLQVVHFDWGWLHIDQKRMTYRIDLVKSWDGDELSRRLG